MRWMLFALIFTGIAGCDKQIHEARAHTPPAALLNA
jgi:hypothetical protein